MWFSHGGHWSFWRAHSSDSNAQTVGPKELYVYHTDGPLQSKKEGITIFFSCFFKTQFRLRGRWTRQCVFLWGKNDVRLSGQDKNTTNRVGNNCNLLKQSCFSKILSICVFSNSTFWCKRSNDCSYLNNILLFWNITFHARKVLKCNNWIGFYNVTCIVIT